ncbi:MAG: protein-disulfide reductase DsbD domain-containing protein, partial [Pseudomonadota bacterium]
GLIAIFAGVLSVTPAAALTTDWQESMGGRTRVIASGPLDPASLATDLAIQMELKPGWKTYWRMPGDTGIAPQFDTSGSSNLKSFDVAWPAPKSFDDTYGRSIGYSGNLVLPVRVVAKNKALPLAVDVTVRYGVCERICVPLEQTFSLVVTRFAPQDDAAAALIASARKSVPVTGTASAPLAVTAVGLAGQLPDAALRVATRVSDPNAPTELFAEGPKDWYLPLPKRTGTAGDEIQWELSLADLPQSAIIPGSSVTFTLVNGKQAIEQVWRLD